jgi:hypothetical protein
LSPNPEHEVGVFAKGTRTNGLPTYKTDRESAIWMVTTGIARWVNNRRNSVIMVVETAFAKIRDMSCQMGPTVIELAAQGSRYHQALCNAWA